MGLVEEGGKVGTAAVSAMASTPLAIALLIVNVGFLGFAGYVLGEVAANASERNKTQMDLIAQLVGDIRDCRQGAKPTGLSMPTYTLDYPPSPIDRSQPARPSEVKP
jgi:hypothetical protein